MVAECTHVSAEFFVGIPTVSDLAHEVELAAGRESNAEAALAMTEPRERAEHFDGAREAAHGEPRGPVAVVGFDVDGNPDSTALFEGPRGFEGEGALARVEGTFDGDETGAFFRRTTSA